MTDKKAIELAEKLAQHCEEQNGCQNCVFRKYGSDHWKCHLDAFDLRDICENYSAKRKKGGYID